MGKTVKTGQQEDAGAGRRLKGLEAGQAGGEGRCLIPVLWGQVNLSSVTVNDSYWIQ